MQPEPKPHLSPVEYLTLDREAEERSEYLDGEMFAMAGGSRKHALIAANLMIDLGSQLRNRPCETYGSDMRVWVEASGLYTYPDMSVVCGEPIFGPDGREDTLRNPILLIEVLSPSSEAYDRGKKFEHYRAIPSFREYLLVSQESPLVDRFLRQESGIWLFSTARGLDAEVELSSIGARLALAEIYAKVSFE
ncbi:MAG TPA: Uma2 family endonuclease [Thermoanaerobaculia bacterium]|jgi:Uma2 family endonuclease|nr:Uma2 family endonuclease [Thermoanaerobaculia bacterium]